ncbi:hypothetical protein BDV59DRAFT_201361 [Aspergillus ambiguus]|uniref:putative myosin class II heavy chain (MHC) n=1 Tax=Aspergillus ambiguus TaxID=176160 RepID=UPI003CCCDA55
MTRKANLDPSVSSVNSAHSPPPHSTDPSSLQDDLHFIAPSISASPSPGTSSASAAGSPEQPIPSRDRSVTSNPPSALHPLQRYRSAWDSSTSSPENRRTESSVYYTTAWGSPYAAPSPRRLSWSLSQSAGVGRGSGDSSPVSLRNPELLRPSPRAGSVVNRSPRRDVPGRKAGKSIKDFTQDWINQYLSGQPRTERSNWLSDDSGSEAPSFFTAPNHFADDPSDDWLGLEQDSRDGASDLLKTPTLADFVSRKGRLEGKPGRQRTKEHLHKREDTLRQEDFWGFAYDKEPQSFTMSELQETQPPQLERTESSSPVEKPLPPPPAADEKPLTERVMTPESAARRTPRPRKKMVWRGKACFVALPLEDKRGTEYRLLTPDDVDRSLKNWEELGYDIRGFSICTPDDESDTYLGGLSRPLYPDPDEALEDWKAGNYGVSIPDKAEWDAYVAHLQEQKLRALGVSLGDDEPPPSVSPASAAMSQMGPFPGLVSSPPIPTASAASNPLSIPHAFSPQLNQSTNASNGIGSIASPASPFSIQTPFMGVEQNLLHGYHMPFQPTPPAQGSLTPQSFFNARQGGPAGTIPGTMPNLTSMMSPVSPMNDSGIFHPGLNEGPLPAKEPFSDHMGIDPQHNVPEGQMLRPAQTPPPNPDHFHASTVEIAQPTPRGHSRGHNLSETLQKGLDQISPNDYHLEESIDRQLDEERDPPRNDRSDLSQSRWALPGSGDRNLQHLPQHVHQFYGGSYLGDNTQEASDIDTNPSLSGTPQGPLANNIPWHEPKPSAGSYGGGHRSKLSSSTLNVDAKEFDPKASTSSNPYQFQDNSMQFSPMGNPMFTFGSGPGFKPSANAFNVTAPSFTPGSSNFNAGQSAGAGEFKFSSASFNVAAPEFNPSSSIHSSAAGDTAPSRTKIFGNVDLSEISKPAKKSKAIPIVRPDSGHDKRDQEERDNENSRSAPVDRHKRARRGDAASDEEAQFSVPSQALAESANTQPAHTRKLSHSPAEGKENASPEETAEVSEVKPVSFRDEKDVDRKGTPVSEASTWTPFDTKDEKAAATADTSMQEQTQEQEHEITEDKGVLEEPQLEETARGGKEPEVPSDQIESDQKNSMLSPTARPFEFKPAAPEFVPPIAEQPKTDPEPKRNDLMASRYAVPSPPTSPKPEPSEPAPAKQEPAVNETPGAPPQTKRAVGHDSSSDSPDDEELNAIMEQLNDDSDVGIERTTTPMPTRAPESAMGPSKEKRHAPVDIRSDPPSPSPGRGPVSQALEVPKLDFDAEEPGSFTPSKGFASGTHSPVRQLIHQNDHISDWDDVISSGEGEKLANRSRFFDRRINDLIGSVVDERLSPLERALGVIQQSVAAITSNSQNRWTWSASVEAEESDADDEDEEYEENASYRTRSPMRQRDRKFDRLKNVIMDAIAVRDSKPETEKSEVSELSQLRDSIAELQKMTAHKLAQDRTADLKEMMQEVVATQLMKQQPRPSDAEEIGADSLMLQIDGLKNMLRMTDERAEQEYKLRREAQDSLAELQRLLKVAEEDAARHSEAAESAEARFLQFKEEKIPYFEQVQFRADTLEQDHAKLKLTLAEISSKNISLEGTLDEHRYTSDNLKRENERLKGDLDGTQEENKKLKGTIDHLKMRIEDGLSIRHNLSEKLDHLQDEMVTVTRDISRDRASWRKREEDQQAKYNELQAAYNREMKLREKLEHDISDLEQQEREAAKLKFIFGQSQQENARLEELVAHLRVENHDLELKAARFEREFNEARESSRVEIQRTRTSMEADLEAANSQVNIVRAELEAQIVRLQSQLENVQMNNDTARERYEMLLEGAAETKTSAVAAAVESKESAMDEQRKLHERTLNDLRERHARALHNSSEDRQRAESHLMDRLALSDEKARHLQDRVNHLEEKLEIAQSAARAAAEAAQSAKAGGSSAHASSPSMSFNQSSAAPEKISPQALRESILVLQDQLQQRETRIEELEQEVAAVDKDAPLRIKEKDTEITWLRELLGVRIDDLQDIINTVSKPSFDHNAVRDAAIRLKANLQMQQQERERAHSGQGFPSIPSLSELTASPRSLPLAAAAAWGSWRKGREAIGSEQTPSKPSNASAFLSGLLTPPSSHLRQGSASSAGGPSAAPWRQPSESRPLKSVDTTPRPLSSRAGRTREPPKTPPLLRRSSYDHDAEPTDYGESSLGEENESTADGLVSASPKDTEGPFGPQIMS